VPGGTDGPGGLKKFRGPGVPFTSIVYGPPFGRNTYTIMLYAYMRLYCRKQTVYRVSESAFSSFFTRPMGRVILVAD